MTSRQRGSGPIDTSVAHPARLRLPAGRQGQLRVGHEITGVVAGTAITIWENGFINPPEDPFHCPPGAIWLLRERGGMVTEVRFMRTPRPALPETTGSDDRTFSGDSDS
jgi:hypothetical protein